jgi:hypothetical protein
MSSPVALRSDAIAAARAHFDSGDFLAELGRRVARRTESPVAGRDAELRAYLGEEMAPYLEGLGFVPRLVSEGARGHFLLAERREGAGLPTVLIYGHGDVVPGWRGAGPRGGTRGRSRRRGIGSTGAGWRTTRGSTASISRRWPV